MPGLKPPAVPLSEAERQELLRLIRAHTTPQHYSFRAHILLLLADGHTAPEVARRLGTSRRTVRLWRRHCWHVQSVRWLSVYTTPHGRERPPPSVRSSGTRSSP